MSGTGRRGASVATSVRATRKKSATRAVSLRESSIKSRLFGTTFLAGALAAAWIVGATPAWADNTGAGGAGGAGSGGTAGAGGAPSGIAGGDSAADGGGGGSGGAHGGQDGGAGGTGVTGAGGAGGTAGAPNGANGVDGTGDSGGGGGQGGADGQAAGGAFPAANTAGGNGGNGGGGLGLGGGGGGGGGGFGVLPPAAGGTNTFILQGGAGGAGGAADSGNAGSGGIGGVGLSNSGFPVVNANTIAGGAGGAGGASNSGSGGSGGAGGDGLLASTTIFNNQSTGVVTGGAGGIGGGGFVIGGSGGAGGAGVSATTALITNGGTITGGAGNSGGNAFGVGGNGGAGGAGISGSDLIVVNATGGTISGGAGGAAGTGIISGAAGASGNAVTFTGGTNIFELQGGSTVNGNVVAFSALDTFVLGGSTNASFNTTLLNTQFTGFGVFQKSGSSVWTLTGASGLVTPWEILQGTLAISSAGNLGTSGDVTFTGGTLQATANVSFANRRFIVGVGDTGTILTDPGVLFRITNNSGTADLTGAGTLNKTGTGTLILEGTQAHSFTGTLNVNAGTLQMNGSLPGATAVNVNSTGTLTGIGTIGAVVNINNGGTLTPGTAGTPATSMNVAGSLALHASSSYVITVNTTTANSTAVTGTASLTGGTVNANFLAGNYAAAHQYTILTSTGLGGTTFAGLTTTGLAPGFATALSYNANNAFLDLTANLQSGGSASGNPQKVANAINAFFNGGGTLPVGFLPLFSLTGGNLTGALASLSGEAATGGQVGAAKMMDQFLSLMIDPFAADGRDANLGGPALGYDRDPQLTKLPPEAGAAYARALRSPRPVTEFERRWSIWGTAFGGYNKTNGDPVVAGTNTVTARDYGLAAGLDYRLTSSTTVGVALAGGATNWGLANGLGGGNSDAFQAGVYGIWRNAGAYLSGAAAFANHWMSTDRVAFASDSLTAKFNAKVYGGRIEAGYRVAVTPLAGLTPYAAVQSQVYRTPDYIETDVSGGGFGLAFAARSVTDTRVEVGARIDGRTAAGNGMDVIFRSRLAWAHDWVSDNTLTATFQALPGASFVVNGAAAPKSLLLANTAAELRLTPATSVTVKLDTELGHGSQTYASTATLRYRW